MRIGRRWQVVVLILLMETAFCCFRASAENPDIMLRDGIRLYQQQKYADAVKLLGTACSIKPIDLSAHYYLGMSALGCKDSQQARDSLSRVVVMTGSDNQMHRNALAVLDRNFKLNPYSCVQKNDRYKTGVTVRWTSASMPLKVYVSHGQQLPDQCFRGFMSDAELRETAASLKKNEFLSGLGLPVNYLPEYRQYAIEGLKQWQGQGVAFEFTEKPQEADILLFWCPSLPGVGGVSNLPAAGCEPAIIQIAVDLFQNISPSVKVDALKCLVAHEFGHALGLAHSEVKDSIMNPCESLIELDRTHFNSVTKNDKATLRALYSVWPGVPANPGIWLFSTTKRK